MDVSELSHIWLKSFAAAKKKSTQRCYSYAVKRAFKFDPGLPKSDISSLSSGYFQSLVIRMAEKYAKSSIKHVVVVFNRIFEYAISETLLEQNPVSCVTVPQSANEKSVVALTQQEREILCDYLPQEPYRDVIEFLLYTGLRRGELADLEWQYYNAQQGLIRIPNSKTVSGIRVIPLIPEAAFIVESQRRKTQALGKPYIFTNTKGNKLTASAFNKLMRRVRKATGIEHFSMHVLRHTFATEMVERKADYKALSQLLGHSSVYFTMQRYVSTEYSFLKEQIMLLSKVQKK